MMYRLGRTLSSNPGFGTPARRCLGVLAKIRGKPAGVPAGLSASRPKSRHAATREEQSLTPARKKLRVLEWYVSEARRIGQEKLALMTGACEQLPRFLRCRGGTRIGAS